MECILNSILECQMSRMTTGQERTRSLAPTLSILEPTPIDPTRIVTVPKVPFDSSPLGKIMDETLLSALCDVLKSATSTPIIGLSPKMTSLLLEVESICNNAGEIDVGLSEKTHDGIAMWSKAGLQRLRGNTGDLGKNDGDPHDASSSCSTSGMFKVNPSTSGTSMRHLSPCCSPEPSSCDTTIPPQNKSSSRSSVTSSEEFPKVGDSNSTTTTFRINQTEQWYQRYLDLIKFRETYGHCLVPLNWPKNPSLAHWVKRQRHQYRAKQEHKHSTLTEERQTLLEQLGFVWDSHASGWEERLKELQDFKERHGHCRVPKTYADNPQLAIWVKCQRRQFKLYSEGKDSNMTNERIHKLRKLGFVFTPRKQKESFFAI